MIATRDANNSQAKKRKKRKKKKEKRKNLVKQSIHRKEKDTG
jgi:hypothetical protein